MAFPIGWQRCCAITVPATKVYGSSLANFPTLLSAACFPNEMVTLAGGNAAQSDGGDIRFSSDAAGKLQLPCEVVGWTQNALPASATAEIWVGVDYLSGVKSTTIYVWYKAGGGLTQPAAGAAFGSQAVWDAAAKGVYHLPNGSSLTLGDSTANANTGTNHSATAATGQIDGGAAFNGTTQYVDLGTGASLQIAGPFTVSAWIKASASQSSGFPQIASVSDATGITGFNLDLLNSGSPLCKARLIVKEGAVAWGTTTVNGTTSLNDNAWHYVVGVYSGVQAALFVDGVVQARISASNQTPTYGTTPHGMIGAKQSLSGVFFAGSLDEVRLRAVVLDAGWIATEYTNQSSPSTFAVPGTPFAPGAFAAGSGYRISL